MPTWSSRHCSGRNLAQRRKSELRGAMQLAFPRHSPDRSRNEIGANALQRLAFLGAVLTTSRPTKTPSIYASISNSAAHRIHSRKAQICRKSGQAHPDAREMFRAFFVAVGAKRKTIKLSVRSLCTTARSTDPEVGYKPQSPLKLEYIRQENGTSTIGIER